MGNPFRCQVLAATEMPQRLVYLALHNDYSEDFCPDTDLSEDECGRIAVRRLLLNDRGHMGPLEHPHLSLLLRVDHNTMVQLRTHRIATFDVQCLAGETKVSVVSEGGKLCRRIPIAKLHEMWQKDPVAVRQLRIRSLDEERNAYTVNHVDAVISSGVKPTFLVTLADGKAIRCTKEHRLLSVDGWRTMGELSVGEKLMVNGRATASAPATYQNKEWLQQRFSQGLIPREIAMEAGVSTEAIKKWAYHHGLSWNRRQWNRGIRYSIDISEQERERRRQHARINLGRVEKLKGSAHPAWRADLSPEKRAYNWLKYARARLLEKAGHRCQECEKQSSRLHCHHMVPVDVDPSLGCDEANIRVLCPACHKRVHALSAHPVPIVSIEPAGECATYDIAMRAPHHNFVANGIVVHNSMRYTGTRIEKVARGEMPPEEVFYARPPGRYHDRQGDPYEWTNQQRLAQLDECVFSSQRYLALRAQGASEEHARGVLPTCYFQNTMITCNIRSWFHMLDLRAKADAQQECNWAMELVADKLRGWIPELFAWYQNTRYGKARLAP